MRIVILLAVALLIGCSERSPQSPDPGNAITSNGQAGTAKIPQSTNQESPATGEPEPVAEGQTAADAAAVVRSYYELIAARKYDEAWLLRWHEGVDAPPEFGRSFAEHAELRATVGTPSNIQGAAGSLYVEVPVQLFGRRTSGAPFSSAGTVTLRRSNDIPGATPEQRRWRIYAND